MHNGKLTVLCPKGKNALGNSSRACSPSHVLISEENQRLFCLHKESGSQIGTRITKVDIKIHIYLIYIFLTYVYLLIFIFGRVKETIYIKTFKTKVHRSTCKIHKLIDWLHANYKTCVLQNQCCIYKTILQIHSVVAKKPNPQNFYLYYHDPSFLYLW